MFTSNNPDPSALKGSLYQSLFATGKRIEREASKIINEYRFMDRDNALHTLIQTIGKVKAYIEIRRSLNVHIGIDESAVRKESLLNELNALWEKVEQTM